MEPAPRMPQKVLVANRGEIAVRVIRACHEVGVRAVAVYSEPDRSAMHVRLADEARSLGGARPGESYLRIDKLIEAARQSGCDAVHPGYGFLSENAAFADAVEEAGLIFIGPTGDSMRLMGDKLAARREAAAAGMPILPGGKDPIRDRDDLVARAEETGYPLMLKAAAGGGGKGIRVVRGADALLSSWERAASEAQTAFGDGAVYIERFLENARHVEIQVLGDGRGGALHLGERECSLQRRHQKLVEESPSPAVSDELRARMTEAACALTSRIRYRGAGTIELLVEGAPGPSPSFYFMEMNTRLQVEHPVTEMVTGIDLVREQLRVAAGEPLALRQDEVVARGAAIEVRVYAEDPSQGFVPSTGAIEALTLPAGPGTRVDSALFVGDQVSVYYDPLIAKLIVWGRDRGEAVARLRRALAEARIVGVATTLPLLRAVAEEEAFADGDFHIHWLEPFAKRALQAAVPDEALQRAAAAAAIRAAERARAGALQAPAAAPAGDGVALAPWTLSGRAMQLGRLRAP